MHILLTNDDGITAKPLWALYRQLLPRHAVTVVAPDRERSAVGHAITLNVPLRYQSVAVDENGKGFAVNGTPADCVKLALNQLMTQKPDLVIAGINPGANVGVNINYSGTVAAAKEAVLSGLPAMAVSINSHWPRFLAQSARVTADLIEQLWQQGLPEKVAVNINVPDQKPGNIAGVQWCRQNNRVVIDGFQKQFDPRGKTYFWYTFPEQLEYISDEEAVTVGDDTALLRKGYITITPIQCRLTDERVLAHCRQRPLNDFWGKLKKDYQKQGIL